MNKQHRTLFISCGLVIITVAALWLGLAAPPANANVTLIAFTATSKTGLKDVYVYWATGTEFDTIGFFVTRKDTLAGSFTRIGEFIPHADSSGLVGAQYYYTDTTTVLNQTYYYILEEITPNDPAYHGPLTVTAGISATVPPPATNTPTSTPTRTPTPSPTATTVTQPGTTANTSSTTSASSTLVVTPRVLTGATITPLPISAGGSSKTVIATPLAKVPGSQQQPQVVATSLPSVPDVAAVTSVPPPAAMADAQAEPTLAPAAAAPALVEPAVVVTESAPAAAAAGSTGGSALVLVGAAFLFLGIAFFILRQARQ